MTSLQMPQSIRRSQYLDRIRHPDPQTVAEAYASLKGKTWEQLINDRTFGNTKLMPVIGLFLNRPAMAVRLGWEFVVLKMLTDIKDKRGMIFGSCISTSGGFAILHSDFERGRTGNIRITDLVVPDEVDG